MVKKTGTASLPLHYGKVPSWLSNRIASLGSAIIEVIALDQGPNEVLRKLSDPFWFQSFGAALGMDWHSSGITTSVMGALKRGLKSKSKELGIHICGGRGKYSRQTPSELLQLSDRLGLNGDTLVRTSKLTAKVDSVAIQDGFSLYLHSFVLTDDGNWVVIQQGMNESVREARRYHWSSENVSSFIEEPHAAVIGANKGKIVNLTDHRAVQARDDSLDIIKENPDDTLNELKLILSDRNLTMPHHHEIKATDVFLKRLHGVLALARETGVDNFENLLLTKGLGPRSMQSIALISEIAYGSPSRFDDPARFAFAHGGKDGHPFPVPLKTYDKTIAHLKNAIQSARVDNSDKVHAFKQLSKQAAQLEQPLNFSNQPNRQSTRSLSDPKQYPSDSRSKQFINTNNKTIKEETMSTPAYNLTFDDIIDAEWQNSRRRGGMTVLGEASQNVERGVRGSRKTTNRPKRAKKVKKVDNQLKLFG